MIAAAPFRDLVGVYLAEYLRWYNTQRPHSGVERFTPEEAYIAGLPALKLAA